MHQAGQSGSIILEAGNEVIKKYALKFRKEYKGEKYIDSFSDNSSYLCTLADL